MANDTDGDNDQSNIARDGASKNVQTDFQPVVGHRSRTGENPLGPEPPQKSAVTQTIGVHAGMSDRTDEHAEAIEIGKAVMTEAVNARQWKK